MVADPLSLLNVRSAIVDKTRGQSTPTYCTRSILPGASGKPHCTCQSWQPTLSLVPLAPVL